MVQMCHPTTTVHDTEYKKEESGGREYKELIHSLNKTRELAENRPFDSHLLKIATGKRSLNGSQQHPHISCIFLCNPKGRVQLHVLLISY